MQNANEVNPAGNQPTPPVNSGEQVVNAAKDEMKNVAQTAGNKVNEVGAQMQSQVQNLGQAGAQQIQNLGKAGTEQLQNMGKEGLNQLGSSVGKILNPVDQKENQPPVKQDEKVYATVAYIPFMALLSIIIKPDSAFVRLHSKQGLLLSILFFFGGMMAAIVTLFGIIGQFLAFVLGLVPLACIIIGIYSMYLTMNGYWWKIPFLSMLADLIPIEMIAKTSKETITGQVGVAKNDYDNRQDTLKMENTEKKVEATPANTAPQAQVNATPAAEAPKTTDTPKNN
jgi:uncharacterized membrane protein